VEPVLAVFSGLWLDTEVVSEDDIQPYVQNALNELEFLLGDTSTTYGALRASLGYPEPFSVKYVEVGNEDNLNNGLESYIDYRFPAFFNAIRAAYPDMVIIASTVASGVEFSNAAGDYHQYTRPDDFVSQFNWFDNYPIDNPTLVGEYATVQPNTPAGGGTDWSAPRSPWPFWIGSVAEAVFTLGIERNGEKMIGASYAPLLQNLDNYQWTVSKSRKSDIAFCSD
jgi:alpha-N-arabinofuranosidase